MNAILLPPWAPPVSLQAKTCQSRPQPPPKPNAQPRKAAPEKNKSLESWIWDAACSIRGAKDAPKYKDFILPLIFTKRLCDVFDDELNRIAAEVGSRKKAFQLAKRDHKLVRFFLPLEPADPEEPVWSVIRKLSDKIGEGVTTHMRAIAKENPPLQGIIDCVDLNASRIFEKGNPKNFIPDDGIQRIADLLIGWQEEEKLSRIVDHAELKKNDCNISPSRYIHTSDAETYRPIAEIVAELDAIELDARKTDKELRTFLKKLGVES